MSKTIRVVLVGAVLLVAVVAINAKRLDSRQVDADATDIAAIDAAGASERLAGALRFPTVIGEGGVPVDEHAFEGLIDYLVRNYPGVHRALERERVGKHSLLYVWPGADPSLDPVLLLAHFDVVPVAEDETEAWSVPPFAGRIADGFVWGRGAIDNKSGVVAILEAIEDLLQKGHRPTRTVYVAFGHDEETGGEGGARKIAALMAERGVRFEYVLDEGFFVTEGLLPGADRPVALIGIAEKGIVSLSLAVSAAPGHSSVPPRHTAIGVLAAALTRLEDQPMAAAIDGVAAEMLAWLAPEMPLAQRMVFANLWLFRPLVEAQMAASPRTDATIRTSGAVTTISGGIRENVLPSQARAVVNFRIRPGEKIADVVDHVRRVVDDTRVDIGVLPGLNSEPSPVSSTDSRAFAAIQRTIGRVFPQALVAPALVVGATDARHFSDVADDVYRFLPIRLGPDDVVRVHGVDERVAVANVAEAVVFYRELLVATTR